jgi:hypothetical protein
LGSKGGLQQWSDKEVVLDGTQSRKTSATTSAADHHLLIVRALENGGGLKQLESHSYDAALAKSGGNVSARCASCWNNPSAAGLSTWKALFGIA